MHTRTRSLVVAIVALAMFATTASPAIASSGGADGLGPFVDVDGAVEEASVAALWEAGIASGCGPWLFCPDEPVSRGEMAAFLVRALGLEPAATGFADVSMSPFAGEIGALVDAGISTGCAEGAFCPEANVTRGQVATMVARALDLPPSEADPFVDDDGSVHEDGIGRLAAAGIVVGCDVDRFCVHRAVTRAELAVLLTRAFGLVPPSPMPTIPDDVVAAHHLSTVQYSWPGAGAEAWRPLVATYFPSVDVDRALRILACESKGDPHAVNPTSGAAGLFQHIPRFWDERSTAAGYGGSDIFDPVANIAVAAWLAYDAPAGGWQHWVCKG
jgi:hypothetical protein